MRIEDQYEAAKAEALKQLALLEIARGTQKEINILGLNGWIFEQTVRCAVEEELKKEKIPYQIKEQEPIVGKAKVDLVVGRVAIEIKVSGFYADVEEKYTRYRRNIEEKGLEYFYITLYEDYGPNIEVAQRVFGAQRVFILSKQGEWERFSKELIQMQFFGVIAGAH